MNLISSVNSLEQNWTCNQCNLYNDILTIHCRDCSNYRPIELEQVAVKVKFIRQGYDYSSLKMKGKRMADSDKIELHSKFFNHEKLLYLQMDITQRREHRTELASLIFEARARMNAVDEVDRETNAKLSKSDREWLVSNQDVTSSDALNQPKIRKERMSKADKLKEQMSALGLDVADVNSLMNTVAKSQSGGSVTSSSTRELKDNYTFVKTDAPVSNNTHQGLLGDISSGLIDGLKNSDRPVADLVSAAVTAGHLADNILGRPWLMVDSIQESKLEEPVQIVETDNEVKEFNPAVLFGIK